MEMGKREDRYDEKTRNKKKGGSVPVDSRKETSCSGGAPQRVTKVKIGKTAVVAQNEEPDGCSLKRAEGRGELNGG